MSSEISGLVRKDVYEIPETAIREAIVNAVVHRDYSMQTRSIFVRIFRDCVEIESPGLLLIDLSEIGTGRSDQIDRVFKATNGNYRQAELDCHYPVEGTNVTLSGRIDIFVEYSDHVEIHDWKTDASDRFLEEYKVQLSVYALAAEGFTGKPVRCFIQYVSNGIGEVEFEPCSKDEIRKRVEEALVR